MGRIEKTFAPPGVQERVLWPAMTGSQTQFRLHDPGGGDPRVLSFGFEAMLKGDVVTGWTAIANVTPSAIQAERRPSPGGDGLRLGAVGPPAQARGQRVSRFWSDRSETFWLL